MSSVKKNFIYNSLYQILKIFTPLVTTPYLARVLGPENVGIYSYTYSITNYFVLFTVLGMSTYGVRAIAETGNNRDERSRVFCGAYGSQLICGFIVIICYIIYCVTAQQGGLVISLLWGLWVVASSIDVTWLMFGVQDFKLTAIRSSLVKLGSVAAIFIGVRDAHDLWIYVLIVSGGFFVEQLIVWPFVFKYVDLSMPQWNEIKLHFIPNFKLFIPVVAISLYGSMDKVMLGYLSDMTEVGYYEYAEKLSRVPMALITALGTVMLPKMSEALSDVNQQASGYRLLDDSMWFMQLLAMAMTFGIIAIAPEFVPVFFGDMFDPCKELMVILSLIIPLVSASNVIGRQYLIPAHKDRIYTISVCAGAVLNLVINLVLIPRYTSMGTAIATVGAELTVLLYQAINIRHSLPVLSYLVNTLPFMLIGGTMCISVRLFSSYATHIFGISSTIIIFETLFGATIYILLSLLYCIIVRPSEFLRLFGDILPYKRGVHK